MKTEPIPAQWDSIACPDIPYWWGMDILQSHWKRTSLFSEFQPGSDEFQEFMFWRRISVIWACSTLEAFVNSEGTAWLGERFYRDNLERLRILQKIQTLYALKYRVRLPRKLERLERVTKLFELRNALVHPKTREVPREGKPQELPCELRAMEFMDLRRAIWAVTTLFEPEGIGEIEDDTISKHVKSDGDMQPGSRSDSPI